MNDIITVMSGLDDLVHLEPANKDMIFAAEKSLNLHFADEYKSYVEKYGAISTKGKELTGITTAKRLDVVSVTLQEREISEIPLDMYVVEDTHIEGILVLQNQAGTIFKFYGKDTIKKIAESLSEYLISK